jgi:hypothetical protein
VQRGCGKRSWVKKKFYKYFTVARRSLDVCDFYEPMGETKQFIKELKKTLPIKDELYVENL